MGSRSRVGKRGVQDWVEVLRKEKDYRMERGGRTLVHHREIEKTPKEPSSKINARQVAKQLGQGIWVPQSVKASDSQFGLGS